MSEVCSTNPPANAIEQTPGQTESQVVVQNVNEPGMPHCKLNTQVRAGVTPGLAAYIDHCLASWALIQTA